MAEKRRSDEIPETKYTKKQKGKQVVVEDTLFNGVAASILEVDETIHPIFRHVAGNQVEASNYNIMDLISMALAYISSRDIVRTTHFPTNKQQDKLFEEICKEDPSAFLGDASKLMKLSNVGPFDLFLKALAKASGCNQKLNRRLPGG